MRTFSVPLILLFATAIAAQPPAKAAKKDSKKGYTDAQLIAAFEQTSPTRVVERRRLAGMMGARTSPALRAF